MHLTFLETARPDQLREALPAFLCQGIDDVAVRERTRQSLSQVVQTWSEAEARGVLTHLQTVGEDQRLYAVNPQCRAVGRAWCAEMMHGAELVGVEHLRAAVAAGPTVLLCNHLSYIDTLAADWVLTAHGHADHADRLLTVAGPKVYADLFRRFAAAALNTLPVPQSTSIGTRDSAVSSRELARQAQASLVAAVGALEQGWIVQVYPEGSRSRTGRLGPFLRGVHRYLGAPVRSVVPVALDGTAQLFPIDSATLHPARVRLSFGPAIEVESAGGARAALAAVHAAIAALLPSDHRPAAGEPAIR